MKRESGRLLHSFLASHLRAYMEFRHGLGYTSFATSRISIARDLDHYLIFRDIASVKEIDERLVVSWVHSIPGLSPRTKNNKIRFARGLFRYLLRIGAAQDNPALRIPELKVRPFKPYVYTLKEIHQILEEARNYQCKRPDSLLGWTLETMIFLIYACGLRISEALNLKIQDVNFEENTLALWKTKFHKERLIPFSKTAAQKLKAYLTLRCAWRPLCGQEAPFFFHARGQFPAGLLERHFRNFLIRCGLGKPKGRGGPNLHGLRHSFAVHRLYKWYQDGKDPLNKLAFLSTYMGHVNIEKTQVYLTINQTLLREGDRRFQNDFEEVAQKALRRACKRP